MNLWLDSMSGEGNYLPTLVFLAPTDCLTAANTIEVLTDIKTRSILQRFKRLSLQTTYLKIDKMEELSNVLHEYYPDKELELNFVIEPSHIENAKYLKKIQDARNECYEILNWQNPLLSFCILNVYEYDRIKKNNAKKILHDYKILHDLIKEHFGCTIDFNFSFTRNPWWSNKDVEESVGNISRIFDYGIDNEFGDTLRFSFGNLNDSRIEKHYNWHHGNLYLSPMVYERIASFHESLRVDLDYDSNISLVRQTEMVEENMILNQYRHSATVNDCNTCPYQAQCIDRYIIQFMEMYDIKDCPMARKAIKRLNP